MAAVIKMNRHRQINLPSSFVSMLSLGDDNYFKAEIKGNQIILTPIDPIERVFSQQDLDLVEATYQREKRHAKPVTPEWIEKAHKSK